MTDHTAQLAALKREWRVTRIVVLGGFVLALAGAAYLAFALRSEVQRNRQIVAAQQAAAERAQAANARAVTAFCPMALRNAKDAGAVPASTTLASPDPRNTEKTGRYLCAAADGATKFALLADFTCTDLKNPHCVSLYVVAQDGGAVRYRRKE